MFENYSSGFSANSSLILDKSPNSTDEHCLTADSTAAIVLQSLAYFVILLVSLLGNSLIILVFLKTKQLRKSINYFVFNMAMSDLFTPLTIMLVRIVELISGSGAFMVHSPLMLGNILCKLCYFLPDVSLHVSVESLLLISLDRFVAVVFPLKAKLISSKTRFICILFTWIIVIAVHAPYFYTFRLFPDGSEYYCQYNWGPAFDNDETSNRYVAATFLAIIVVPIGILIIVYGAIVITLKRSHSQRKKMSVSARSHGYQNNMQIIGLSVAIVTAFIFCMVPYLVFMFCTIFVWNWEDPPICAFQTVIPFVAQFLVHSWSAVNPCICFIFSKNYCRSLKHILSYREGSLRMQTETTRVRKRTTTSV